MFKGFNLKTQQNFKEYYDIGLKMYSTMKKQIENNLDEYVGENGSLDGTKIQDDWFPQINANTFISHSHNDREMAIGFAGWLKEEYSLFSFIDSCIWGYANELLKQIDDAYCLNVGSKDNYSYEKRNFSTSHVHMMLSTALTTMIDKTECIFFLNTSNSTCSTKETIKNKTNSPWIYSEIVTTNLIQKRNLSPDRMKKFKQVLLEKSLQKFEKFAQMEIQYDLDFSHLYALNDQVLFNWKSINKRKFSKGTETLDNLYQMANS